MGAFDGAARLATGRQRMHSGADRVHVDRSGAASSLQMGASVRRDARLASAKRLLAHINEQVLPGVGFEMWDKTTLPEEPAPDMPILAIADEGVVAALVRRPNMHT